MRFPEFLEQWEEKMLGEVAIIVGGGTPDTSVDEYWNGNIQWFTPTEIKENYVDKSLRTITRLGLKKSSAKLLPKGAILLTTRATIGDVAIALRECTTNQGFQSLIVNEGFSNIFISNWLKQNKKELIKKANGSTFIEISKSEIETIYIKIPTLAEQTKIASFLSKLDDRIQAQSQTIE
ncbi:restriction endonuclease subunit S, partial [Capnocytophaga sp.]|uniref:restriction endonuclease subunit S n=1 Tax=Capnocytophaga sp. TaxID=44737 RepID=UPI0026DC9A16